MSEQHHDGITAEVERLKDLIASELEFRAIERFIVAKTAGLDKGRLFTKREDLSDFLDSLEEPDADDSPEKDA